MLLFFILVFDIFISWTYNFQESSLDITEVVKEILTTSRGSEFYVLKQAADLDNNDLISSQEEDDELANTEHETAAAGMQELTKNMDIPKSFVNLAKKT